MHPCALPVMVSRVSAALTSSALQADAFTGLAFWTANGATRAVAILARTSGIEPLSMRGQRMALPIYQVREFRRLLENQPKDGG